MLNRHFRLPKNSDFKRVINCGKKINNEQFLIHYLPAETLRVGITCSTKLLGAVGRNKARRQISACLRHFGLTLLPNYEFVISIRAGFLTNDYQTNCQSLLSLLSKIIEGVK